MNGNCINSIISICIHKSKIYCSVSIETSDIVSSLSAKNREGSSDEYLSITLNFYGSDLCSCGYIGIEGSIQCSIGIKTSKTITSHSSYSGKGSSDEYLSIWLDCTGIDDIIRIGIEGGIKHSTSTYTSNTITSYSSYGSKLSSNNNLIIWSW